MRKYLLSAALAAFISTVAAGSAQAYDHRWHEGYHHGHWHGPVVVRGGYYPYAYYPAYYPAVAVAPAPAVVAAAPGFSLGLFFR